MPPAADESSSIRFMLRALGHRNYRLFFGGQLLSLIGTWLSTVATSWLVYRLASQQLPGQQAMILGLVNFSAQIPIFLFSPIAGVWVDRWPRRDILIATQALSMLQSFALAGMVYFDVATISLVIVLSIFQGMVNAMDVPARQSFVIQLVSGHDLSNAIALNSSMVHSARFLGPAIAGVLIYVAGEGLCFLIDGFSYLAVLAALLMMRIKIAPTHKVAQRAWHAMREGIRYGFGFPPIRSLLIVVSVTSLMSMSQSVLMPIVANQILHGNERALGMLLGSSGFGAVAGSLYLASRRSVLGLGCVIGVSCLVLGTGLVIFAFSRSLWLSMLLLVPTGAAFVVQLASSNTVLQTIVDDDKRGRVMSLYTMAFMGMSPFGSLLAGAVASVFGAPWSLGIAGAICFATGVAFLWRLKQLRIHVRPIYIQKGILPQIAEGLQTAAGLTTAEVGVK